MHLPLLADLQRRRAFRAFVGYAIVAFAVLQVIEPIMHGLRWPDAVISYVVAALAVGFPVVVGLAWIFDVKAAGAVQPAPMRSRRMRVELPLAWVAALLAAGGMLWYMVARPRAIVPSHDEALRATLDAGPPASDIRPLPSIAVLPFVNLSAEKDLTNVFVVQEEIARAVAAALKDETASRADALNARAKNRESGRLRPVPARPPRVQSDECRRMAPRRQGVRERGRARSRLRTGMGRAGACQLLRCGHDWGNRRRCGRCASTGAAGGGQAVALAPNLADGYSREAGCVRP